MSDRVTDEQIAKWREMHTEASCHAFGSEGQRRGAFLLGNTICGIIDAVESERKRADQWQKDETSLWEVAMGWKKQLAKTRDELAATKTWSDELQAELRSKAMEYLTLDSENQRLYELLKETGWVPNEDR